MQAFIGYGRRADPVRSRSFIAQRRTPKLDAIVLLRAGNPNHDDTTRLQDSVGVEYAHGRVVQPRRRMPWPPSICHASHLAIPFVPRTAFGRCARRYWTMKRYTRCLHSPRGWYGCALRGRGKPRGTRAGRLVACDAGQSLKDPRCLQGWCMSHRPGVCGRVGPVRPARSCVVVVEHEEDVGAETRGVGRTARRTGRREPVSGHKRARRIDQADISRHQSTPGVNSIPSAVDQRRSNRHHAWLNNMYSVCSCRIL